MRRDCIIYHAGKEMLCSHGIDIDFILVYSVSQVHISRNILLFLQLFPWTSYSGLISIRILLQVHDPSVVCVVFDVTNEESFRNAPKWLEEMKQKCGDELLPGVLVGTKIDLSDLRVISPMAGKDVANSLGLTYFECSAVCMHPLSNPKAKALNVI